ncbi:MAG: amidohydrolase [Oscillospiraceae bacterium]|nr:amidohydrolase [Oscillospiraceae bacterium]
MLLINANITTMEEKDFENGYVLVKDGKFEKIGDMSELPKKHGDDQVIDLGGKRVFPGFIDAHSHLGVWEDGLGAEGDDGNEDTDPVSPQLRAIDAVNPVDFCFKEAVDAGITTVLTGPGSANPIAGDWIAMKTVGRRIDDMVLGKSVGMKFALGENPKMSYHSKSQTPVTRMATAALIREQLKKAKRYISDKEQAEQDEDYDEPEYDMKCEALIPVLKREMKAFFHAHRTDDIFTAIRISKEFDLDCVIVHGTEGYLIADILKKENVPVIAGPIICDRSKPELKGLTPKNAGVLNQKGVLTAICTDHPVIPIQYLGLSAGIAVGAGMDFYEALRAITINAARICGIEDKVGSIKSGKCADLVVFDSDPFSSYAKPEMVVVDGNMVERL